MPAAVPLWSSAVAAARLAWRAAPLVLPVSAVVKIVTGAAPVLVAWLTKLVIDGLVRDDTGMEQLLVLAVALVVAGLLVALLPRASAFLEQESDRAIAMRIQEQLYGAVERFRGMVRFEDPQFQDRLRLAQQMGGRAPGQLIAAGTGFAGSIVTTCGFVGSLLVISPVMAGVVCAAAIPAVFAQVALSRRRAGMMWTLGPVERREFFYSTLLANDQAAKEIRLFGSGAFLRARMLAERRTADAHKRRMDLREFAVQGGLGTLSAAVAGGGLVWAVVNAYRGVITPGDVTMLVAAVGGVQGALAVLTTSLAGAHQQLLLFGHFLAVEQAPPDLVEIAKPVPTPPLRHGIELRDVWFRYSDAQPWVLAGVDLFLPAGSAIGLIGRNGAGKSTLVKLLCRLYDPTRGDILWDGVNLRDMDVAKLRERIGAVFQDFMEYDLTAAENIAIGSVDALDDRARLVEAARRAGVDETLAALPQGYDTMLSRIFFSEADKEDPTTGVVLSGGQWQRLALARALLRDGRDLLILDEPSSGLDAVAEHDVHTRMRSHRRGRTSVLISHRLGAVREADVLVVLDGGVIVERGTHDELMATGGVYAELFTLQAAGYQNEVVTGS